MLKKSLTSILFAATTMGAVVPSAQAAEVVKSGPVVGPVVVGPVKPGPLPPRGCPVGLNEMKTFTYATGDTSDGLNPGKWSVDFSTSFGVRGDCESLMALNESKITAKVFGGALAVTPAEVRAEAKTTKALKNSVAVKMYVMGKQLKEYTIAESTEALSFRENEGYTLPSDLFTGSWTKKVNPVPVAGGELNLAIAYSTVGRVAFWSSGEVSSNKVRVQGIAAGDMSGYARATGTYHRVFDGGEINLNVDIPASIDVFRTVIGLFAEAKPDSTGQWRVKVNGNYSLSQLLSADLTVHTPEVPNPIGDTPLVPSYDIPVIKMQKPDQGDDFSVEHAFTKQF